MACDKPITDPNGDYYRCVSVSACADAGGCGCTGGSSTAPDPVLPRCQDIVLPAGTYTNATIVVNSSGCIAAVVQGEPELYTPDECCGSSSGGSGTGATGPRGPKGDAGQAATVSVETVIGTGTAWTVENVGTSSAAILRFTSPPTSSGGSSTSGATGTIIGLETANGIVKSLPTALIATLSAAMAGTKASLATLTATTVASTGAAAITLNIDALATYIDDADTALGTRITNVSNTVDTHTSQIAALQSTVNSQAATITTLQQQIAALDARITALGG